MIARCGLALLLSVVAATAVQAAVVVVLEPETPPPYGGPLDVGVFLRQDAPGDNHLLRLVQFDLTVTVDVPELERLGLDFPPPHNGISFWDFTSLAGCAGDEGVCGNGYLINDSLDAAEDDDELVRPNMVWISFIELVESEERQIMLLGDDALLVKVGVITVNVPIFDGVYHLDVLNAGEADSDLGAEIHWGFGTDEPPDPLTEVRANTGGITGGELDICVGIDCRVNLLSSIPECDASLPWLADGCIELTFDGPPGAAPSPGDVEIRALLDAGAVGPDISSNFLFSVVGNVLRIEEDGDVFANNTWYGVRNVGGWSEASNFEQMYVVVYGDSTGDGRTSAFDANDIWNNRIDPAPACSRRDLNSDGRVNAFDANIAWNNRGDSPDPPTGHACSP